MENTHDNQLNPAENPGSAEEYQPRPVWQVWAARLGLVLFLLVVVLQILNIAGGGL